MEKKAPAWVDEALPETLMGLRMYEKLCWEELREAKAWLRKLNTLHQEALKRIDARVKQESKDVWGQ